MKLRIARTLVAGTAAIAIGLSTAPAASAQERPSESQVKDLLMILDTAIKVADAVSADGEETGLSGSGLTGSAEGDLSVVADPIFALLESEDVAQTDLDNLGDLATPENLEALIDALLPESVPDISDLVSPTMMRPVRGSTSDGRTVVFPTTGRFTSGYGARWGSQHYGIDIANPVGTPILAVMDGEVISAGPAQGFGNWVRIRHDDGSISVYGHMSTIDVRVGERVTAGQRIAGMGNEGRSTGSHLHFEIRPDGVNAVDPVEWFSQQGITVR